MQDVGSSCRGLPVQSGRPDSHQRPPAPEAHFCRQIRLKPAKRRHLGRGGGEGSEPIPHDSRSGVATWMSTAAACRAPEAVRRRRRSLTERVHSPAPWAKVQWPVVAHRARLPIGPRGRPHGLGETALQENQPCPARGARAPRSHRPGSRAQRPGNAAGRARCSPRPATSAPTGSGPAWRTPRGPAACVEPFVVPCGRASPCSSRPRWGRRR
jgi:hypothetical protein